MYQKIKVRVSTLDGDVTAWIYVVDGYEDGLPQSDTLRAIIDAATLAGAPVDYIQELGKRPTA
jgi:hypothetical protein